MSFWGTARRLIDVTLGLPHEHRTLMFAIAAKYDEATARSGTACRHSYQAFRELLEVESTRGRPERHFTRRQVRHFLAQLERQGLIEHEGDLVFKVPVLAQDKSAQRNSVHTSVSNSVTGGDSVSRTTALKINGKDAELGPELGPELGHTSVDDDDISGAVIHHTEYQQGGPSNLPFAAFFQSQGFSRKQISDAADTLKDWSARGVTADLVKHVVALVDDRLQRQGNDRPWSPKYYDREIKRRVNSEGSDRTDAGAGPGGEDEVDAALGGSLH